MSLPFTVEQFLDTFAAYNEAVWPAQLLFNLLPVAMLALAVRPTARAGRWITVSLAGLWVWMGVVYHWGFFAAINPAARLFGGLFVLQGMLFLLAGFRGHELRFRLTSEWNGVLGVALLAYALLLYPAIGELAGHAYPRGPTFGLPCPTTIATFAVLLWAAGRVPLWLLVIPAGWSLLGASAALRLGIVEDLALPIAGVLGTLAIVRRNRQWRDGRARAVVPIEHLDEAMATPTVLVAYRSGHGQTAKIADRIAEHLARQGVGATLVDLRTVPPRLDPRDFDAIVIGGSVMYGRHHRGLRRFVRDCTDALREVPSAFFSVSGAASSDDPAQRETALGCIEAFLRRTGWRPALAESIAGAMAYTRYGPIVRLIVRTAAERSGGPTDTSRDHEFTDWAQVARFADAVAELARASRSAPHPPTAAAAGALVG